MSVRARQLLLARFLDDPSFEAEVRVDPEGTATTRDCPLAFVHWVAALPRYRVEGFRRSQVVKARRRHGEHD